MPRRNIPPAVAGDLELERVEHAFVRSEVLAVEPDIGVVVDRPEAQEQSLAAHRRRHAKGPVEPDRAEEVADLVRYQFTGSSISRHVVVSTSRRW
jgi:hypothetical protein